MINHEEYRHHTCLHIRSPCEAKRLMAWNKVIAKKGFIKTCQFVCEHGKGFKCRSVDLSSKEQACVLSEGDEADSYLRNYKWKYWQYSEIQCKDEWRNRSSCTLVGPFRGNSLHLRTMFVLIAQFRSARQHVVKSIDSSASRSTSKGRLGCVLCKN
ncbi:hypothetical protein CAPTEDRAFT_196966 [Capitella teleta]|uniref:Uncharacterized protein n=1 Tax=Capitella teleta TaxID=283909 RepID=R7TBV9_CAPTE|nr:hypothetical protein CAPTEDRAFT_196966 [Capitella teleta]|eukprot:ELT90977.1 hypothetical protein CAPTEDRAFT_196966 [Capitella teleta]